MKARKTYQAPDRWCDVQALVLRIRQDMLTEAADGATDAGYAARRLDMKRSDFVQACRRLNVPVDHLLDKRHPRWGNK